MPSRKTEKDTRTITPSEGFNDGMYSWSARGWVDWVQPSTFGSRNLRLEFCVASEEQEKASHPAKRGSYVVKRRLGLSSGWEG